MKEPRSVSGWGDGIRPRGEPLNALWLGTTTLGSHCSPMSGFRTASTLAHMLVWILEIALRCLQKEKVSFLGAHVNSPRAPKEFLSSPLSTADVPRRYPIHLVRLDGQRRDQGCCELGPAQMGLLVPTLACTLLAYQPSPTNQVLQFSYQGGTGQSSGDLAIV